MHPTRIFKTPEELLKAFDEFKVDVEKQSGEWLKIQYVGKDGERMADGLKVPLTIEGFKRFFREKYGCVNHYFNNSDGLYDDFSTICAGIREQIRENQIIGGLLGLYNPSITQRLNGLTERSEVVTKSVQVLSLDPLADAPTDNSTS